MITKSLGDGISYSFIETPRFKTTMISVGFYLPSGINNAANSLALSLMKSGTQKYPDLYSFNRKLASLYGAGISSWCTKNGDSAEFRINLTVNDDRFSLNGENTVDQAGELLCDMIFGKYGNGCLYDAEVFSREKRLLCEKILGTVSDKRTYARMQCEALMCENEPFGFNINGTLEQVEKLTQNDVALAIKRLIETAYISVLVIGSKEPVLFINEFEKHVIAVHRNFKALPQNTVKSAKALCEKNEKMAVKQGKLVLGMRNAKAGSDRETIAAMVMTDIFGGGPHSKLFCNVREKMSLCYYCSARPIRSKGLMFIESGVEESNMNSAQKAILEQFEDVKNGAVTEKEFTSSKLSLIDMIRSAQSDQTSLLHWYAARALDNESLSPEEACKAINSVTKEDVINAAKGFDLDTVYRLLPDGSLKEED